MNSQVAISENAWSLFFVNQKDFVLCLLVKETKGLKGSEGTFARFVYLYARYAKSNYQTTAYSQCF